MIVSIDVEKALGKIQYSFMIKALNKVNIKDMYLDIIKAICDRSIADIILHGE